MGCIFCHIHTHSPKDISVIPCWSLQAFISPPTLNWAPFQQGRPVLQFHNTKSFKAHHSYLPLNPYYGLLLTILTCFNQPTQITVCIYLWLSGKESTCSAGEQGFNPWVRKIPWKRNGNPLWYSCLENPMGRGTWWTTAHELSDWNHDDAKHWTNHWEQSSSSELPPSSNNQQF